MTQKEIQILLTNDDGIDSPGLWAAAKALSCLGYVTVAAPRDQQSGSGRSFPHSSDGKIEKQTLQIGDEHWDVYAIGGSPAQVVAVAVLAIMPDKPDLVVSGINYGENPSMDITMSGTVGAAMEGAAFGIPSLAISLQLRNVNADYLSYSRKIDFSAAAHFTALFGEMLLEGKFPQEVDLLKVDVPTDATEQTEWKLASLSRERYFYPMIEKALPPDSPVLIDSLIDITPEKYQPDTDVYIMGIDKKVAVVPMTLDMTARVDLKKLENKLKRG